MDDRIAQHLDRAAAFASAHAAIPGKDRQDAAARAGSAHHAETLPPAVRAGLGELLPTKLSTGAMVALPAGGPDERLAINAIEKSKGVIRNAKPPPFF